MREIIDIKQTATLRSSTRSDSPSEAPDLGLPTSDFRPSTTLQSYCTLSGKVLKAVVQ